MHKHVVCVLGHVYLEHFHYVIHVRVNDEIVIMIEYVTITIVNQMIVIFQKLFEVHVMMEIQLLLMMKSNQIDVHVHELKITFVLIEKPLKRFHEQCVMIEM